MYVSADEPNAWGYTTPLPTCVGVNFEGPLPVPVVKVVVATCILVGVA
jgi:hypothetical protein